MKFMGFCLRPNNKSGIILIVVLWVLAILSVLAIGLGRSARIDLALVKHHIGKLKADGLVLAGYNYAANQIHLDTEDQKASVFDTVYQCGFDLKEGVTPENIFKDVTLADGSFDISYVLDEGLGSKDICYGFQDEDRRINLNGINKVNSGILVHLFMLVGLSEEQAQMLAAQVVDWHDSDEEKMNTVYGAEKEDYLSSSKPYGCKNLPFESVEELLLLKDMTEDVFKKVEKYLTVFPLSGSNISVNVNTAPEIVLKSIFRFVAAQQSLAQASDADSLTKALIAYRQGDDGRLCTADDQLIDSTKTGGIGLSPTEQAIYLTASSYNYVKDGSDFFRATIKGTDRLYRVSSSVDMVIDRQNSSVVLWKRK